MAPAPAVPPPSPDSGDEIMPVFDIALVGRAGDAVIAGTTLLPMLAGTAGNVDIGSVIGQAVGGGVAGAIVTFVVGLIKNTMAGQPAR